MVADEVHWPFYYSRMGRDKCTMSVAIRWIDQDNANEKHGGSREINGWYRASGTSAYESGARNRSL